MEKVQIQQRITPFLWFDNNAEEAAGYYTSFFKNSGIDNVSRTGEKEPDGKAKALVVNFRLDGQAFMALNGGPQFKFTEAISMLVNCETQEEVDHFWDKLSEGGEKSRCGWLKDRYGLSWQVVPTILGKLMADKDPLKAKRVMNAMLQMDKLDIQTLKDAYEGKGESK